MIHPLTELLLIDTEFMPLKCLSILCWKLTDRNKGTCKTCFTLKENIRNLKKLLTYMR